MRAFLFLVLLTWAPAWALETTHYVVRIESGNGLRAFVEARLAPVEPALSMSDYGAWSQSEGWATFVSSLSAAGSDDRALRLDETGKLQWAVADVRPGETVTLSYVVDLSHAQGDDWPDGPRTTAAYWDGRGLSLLTAMLFIHPTSGGPSTIEFDLPGGWEASAPWARSEKGAAFEVPDTESLTRNVVVVGRHDRRELNVGGSEITLAVLGLSDDTLERIEPVVRTTLRDFQKMFGQELPRTYLMAWIADSTWDTGEAYEDSYIVATTREITARSRPGWANTIAHELFHIWLGHRIDMEPWSQSQWFSEGVTEYMANTSLARTGLIDERQTLHRFQNHALLFLRFRYRWGTPYEPISLVDAGEKKSQYNVAIYDGGWVAAFCLDVLMREASANEVGLPDLMRHLDAEFGDGSKKLTNADVVKAAEALSGAAVADFFDRYVAGVEMIPLEDFLERAGFDAVAHSRDVDLLLDPQATGLRARIRKSIIGR